MASALSLALKLGLGEAKKWPNNLLSWYWKLKAMLMQNFGGKKRRIMSHAKVATN